MKFIPLLIFFSSFIGFTQEIDSLYYFEINDSILKSNGVYSFNNQFLISKEIEKNKIDCLNKIERWNSTVSLNSDTTDFYLITYNYNLGDFGKFTFNSILGFYKDTKKLITVYYQPHIYLLFKNTKIEEWNNNTFNTIAIISKIESHNEIKIKSVESLEYSVDLQGFCKDAFFIKNKYSKYTPFDIRLVLFYKDNCDFESTGFGVSDKCSYDDYLPLNKLNLLEFIDVNFIFETEEQFFYPNNKKHCKSKIDYKVLRYHQIKLGFSDHKILADELLSYIR
jgi:hypothetical protein